MNSTDPTHSFKDDTFSTRREEWNEYLLEGGVTVRLKTVAMRIQRVIDVTGNQVTAPDGSPVVRVSHQTLVSSQWTEGGPDA